MRWVLRDDYFRVSRRGNVKPSRGAADAATRLLNMNVCPVAVPGSQQQGGGGRREEVEVNKVEAVWPVAIEALAPRAARPECTLHAASLAGLGWGGEPASRETYSSLYEMVPTRVSSLANI